jgi:hypothetical protein
MHFKTITAGVVTMTTLALGGVAYANSSHGGAVDQGARPSTGDAAAPRMEHFLITGITNRQGAAAHGVFAGAGPDVSKGQRDHLYLGGGTVTVYHPSSQEHFVPHLNPKNCFVKFKITGKYQLVNGTGRLQGVQGHGRYVVHGQGIAGRDNSGNCSLRTRPKYDISVIRASGPARMP